MGCWGITAFESDAGLDAADFVRTLLPESGKAELGTILAAMREDEWMCPKNPTDGESHTGPMALAEIMMAFLEGHVSELDYDEEWAAQDNKFAALTSFTADSTSVEWLRDYLSQMLTCALENAAQRAKHGTQRWDQWNGWSAEQDWLGWQAHMKMLIGRLNTLGSQQAGPVELVRPREPEVAPIIEPELGGIE